jgi:hypothetical protein
MAEEVVFQNDPVDPSTEFQKQHNHFFVAERAEKLDPESARGEIRWKRMALAQRVSYHQVTLQLDDFRPWRDMPEHEYPDEPCCPFALSFLSRRTVRLQVAARPSLDERSSPMLDRCEPGAVWDHTDDGRRCTWRTEHGR